MAAGTVVAFISSSSRPGRVPTRGHRVPLAAAAGRQVTADERRLPAPEHSRWEGDVSHLR